MEDRPLPTEEEFEATYRHLVALLDRIDSAEMEHGAVVDAKTKAALIEAGGKIRGEMNGPAPTSREIDPDDVFGDN